MRIQISDGRVFKVGFRYEEVPSRYQGAEKPSTVDKIEAYVQDIQDAKDKYYTASVTRYPEDDNNRVVGRKIALAKALQKAFPSYTGKPIRAQIWEALKQRGVRGFINNKNKEE